MHGLPKTFGGLSVMAALLAGGCSYTTQVAKVHPPFVPPVRRPAAVALLPGPPPLPAASTVPEIGPVLRASLQFSESRSQAEALIQRAYLRLQKGKGLYQANDISTARVEFNAAIDLMLSASQQDPGDRQEFERKLDEMVDAIHRFDLAGLGASET